MWEYCKMKVGWCRRRKTTTMIPCKKGRKGKITAYGYVGRTTHLMNSGIMDKVRNIFVLTGSMQKTVLKRSIAILARSETEAAIQLGSQKHIPSLLI